jgi:hypothetical protein
VRGKRPPRAGQVVRFSAVRSTDPDGRVAIHRWRFGDGKHARAAKAKIRHRFRRPGRYTIRLRVRDDEGCSARLLYTGQSAYCNGGPEAVASKRIRVRPMQR